MKRLFSKAMLMALIISLVPVQSAQANQSPWKVILATASMIGAGLAGWYIGKEHDKKYQEEVQEIDAYNKINDENARNPHLKRPIGRTLRYNPRPGILPPFLRILFGAGLGWTLAHKMLDIK